MNEMGRSRRAPDAPADILTVGTDTVRKPAPGLPPIEQPVVADVSPLRVGLPGGIAGLWRRGRISWYTTGPRVSL